MNVHVQEHIKILRHFYSISNEIMLTLYSMYVGRICMILRVNVLLDICVKYFVDHVLSCTLCCHNNSDRMYVD